MLAPDRVRDRWIAPLVVLVVSLTHLWGYRGFTGDTFWYVQTAMSIVCEHDIDLDEFSAFIPPDDYAVRRYGEHLYDYFPLGNALFAVPFVCICERISAWVPGADVGARLLTLPTYHLQALVAVAAVALTAGMIYLISRLYLPVAGALIASFIFAFCTSAWSTASRTLWQHGPSMLMLSIALYVILLAERRPPIVALAGFPLAFAYVIRPTNALSVAVLSIYVLLRFRLWGLAHVASLGSLLGLFALHNLRIYGQALPPYYVGTRLGLHPAFVQALAGNLISPSRGLFVFSPVLLFSLVGLVLEIKRAPRRLLTYAVALIILLHWLVISAFPHWWGGWSIGPRMFSDMLPYQLFFLLPVLRDLPALAASWRTRCCLALAFLILWSGLAHGKSALDPNVQHWNAWPHGAPAAQLWDWGDIQFLRGIQVVAPISAPLPAWNGPFVPNRMRIQFGRAFLLRGYELHWVTPSLLSVVLYWQAREQPEFDYSAFLHVVDANGNLVAQKDHPPGSLMGYRPAHWQPGDLVYDEHLVVLPSGTAGELRLTVGVYDWRTGERLPARSGEESVGDEIALGDPLNVSPIYWNRMYFPLLYRGMPSR
jgi:hypothetical protein